MSKFALPMLLLLGMSSCGPADNDPGPGGVSVEDAQALDEAAAKLDSNVASQPESAPAK